MPEELEQFDSILNSLHKNCFLFASTISAVHFFGEQLDHVLTATKTWLYGKQKTL
jgi:hypothetical protein